MRLLLFMTIIIACVPLPVMGAEAIAPGMSLDAATTILQRHGYEVDRNKYGLAMAPTDEENELDFCAIDEDITLILTYRTRTREVRSLSVVFIPPRPTSKLQLLEREVLEMQVEPDGLYTLKMRRQLNDKGIRD